ncbi:hypothetical protein V5O48_016337, partial [Marasmius crinis-equi]
LALRAGKQATRHRGIKVRGCNTSDLVQLAVDEAEHYCQLTTRVEEERLVEEQADSPTNPDIPVPRSFIRLEDLNVLVDLNLDGEENGRKQEVDHNWRASKRQNRREKRSGSGLHIKAESYTIPRRVVWTGPHIAENVDRTGPITLDQALALPNMQLVRWDGTTTEYVCVGENDIPLITMGALPSSDAFEEHKRNFDRDVEAAYEKMFGMDESHRRGDYGTERSGVSFGGGQTKPSNLLPRVARNGDIIDELKGKPAVKAVVGYADYLFKANHKPLHTLYHNVNRAIVHQNPTLKTAFGDKSAFAACHFNFHNVVTVPHRDFKNLVFGMCMVYASGDYDYREGGHLILWDLGLVIEFPPGSFIFLPSALLEHSNVCIRDGERRSSMVLFSASGLFRWVHNGGMSDTKFEDRLKLARDEGDKEAAKLLKEWKAYKKELPNLGLHFLHVPK